jgi:hypothetical protein
MSPWGHGTKNDCAGEGQQQFTRTRTESVFMGLNTSIFEAPLCQGPGPNNPAPALYMDLFIGFRIFMADIAQIVVLWVVTPYSLLLPLVLGLAVFNRMHSRFSPLT